MSEDTPHIDANSSEKNSKSAFNSGIIRKTEYFDLFISYKRDNGGDHGQKLAEELYHKLTADGYKVWLDNEEIGFSSNFEKRLEEAILHSKKVACILSPAWVESENCRYEHLKAVEFEKRLIPVHYKEFRTLLSEKKNQGILTDYQWRKLDKPQEVNFSSPDKFEQAYQDLKAVCDLKDEITTQHTKILTESYYWNTFSKPKSMLRTGEELSRMRILKSKCDGDAELPSFTELQNSFLKSSQEYVTSEASNRRAVFIAFKQEDADYAADLNMELRLNNVTTFFHEDLHEIKDSSSLQDEIIRSDNVINVICESSPDDDDQCTVFAVSKNKRVLDISPSKSRVAKLKSEGGKNIFQWTEQARIDGIISTINGDKAYNLAHTKLLSATFEWENAGKSDNKLLGAKDAETYQEWYKIAEELGTEPQPNVGMISFVERSITYADAVRKRKRLILWSTFVGILLFIATAGAAFWLNNMRSEAENAAKKAKTEASKADEKAEFAKREEIRAQKNAEDAIADADAAKISARTDSLAAVDAKNSAKNALALAASATDSARVATEKARLATEKAKLANIQADTAKAQAGRAKVEALLAQHEADSIKRETKKATALMNARYKIEQVYRNIQAGNKPAALKDANAAYELLADTLWGDSTNPQPYTMQLQPLYNAYNMLTDKKRTLYSGPSKSIYAEKVLIEGLQLEKLKEIGHNEKSVQLPGQDREVSLNYYTELNLNTIKVSLSDSKITALALSKNNEFMAMGFEDKRFEVWDLNSGKLVEDSSQTHRISSLAFSPDNSKLAITGLGKYFNIFELNTDGTHNKDKGDAITQPTIARIEKLYFYNNEVLILIDPNGMATAWSTSVDALTLYVNKYPSK